MSSELRAIARQTVAIVEAGEYVSPAGRVVRIGDAVARAVAGTRLYGPDGLSGGAVAARGSPDGGRVRVEVTAESSLAAARRLLAEDSGAAGRLAVLNFASARNPGGGFLNGVQAQEESLCRASALYASLRSVPPFYEHHRRVRDPFYSHRVIFSAGVPVFRDDGGALLEEPFGVSFLTAAAPNAGVIAAQIPEAVGEIPAVLAARSARVLAAAAAEGQSRLVLGAWGCGVFRNSPADVAAAFRAHLGPGGVFAGTFTTVVFAILDSRPASPTRAAFRAAFRTAFQPG